MIHRYKVFQIDMLQLEKYVANIHANKALMAEAQMKDFFILTCKTSEDIDLLFRYVCETKKLSHFEPTKKNMADYLYYHGLNKNQIAKAMGYHFATVKGYIDNYYLEPEEDLPFSKEREALIEALKPLKEAINKHNFNFVYKL